MTDFAALLRTGTSAARSVELVTAAGLDAWRTNLGERARAAVTAGRFKGKPGELVILPGDAPGDWSAAAGIGPDGLADPWALASVAASLPGGTYRLASGEPGAAGLGWLLAQHRFTRYRKAEDSEPPRVLLSNDINAVRDAVRMAEAVALVRDLVDTPAGDLGPAELAAVIQEEVAP